jgi:6-phosphogluconolactonase (cycloisomerase 2 family)
MPTFAYVSLQGDDRILRFTQDPATGALTPLPDIALSGGPAAIAVEPGQRFAFVARRGERRLSSFRIDPLSGDFTLIGSAGLASDPCWLATDRSGRFVLGAYYEGRGVTIHRIGLDGVAADLVEKRETARGAHCFQTDPTNRYAYVPHIAGRGPNEIWQYRFDERTGRLSPNTPAKVVPDQPLGPRHYCFHPTLDRVYFSNEQGSSATTYRLDPATGALSALQTLSTLPAGWPGSNSTSKCKIVPSGRFVYVPNRGHDSIAGFAVDPGSGLLTAIGQTPSEKVPRAICVDPTGSYLYAAGHASGRLASYRIEADGALSPLRTYPLGERPMWVTLIRL